MEKYHNVDNAKNRIVTKKIIKNLREKFKKFNISIILYR